MLLLIYECADSLMTFLIYQYVDVLTIPHAYENVLLYVYCHSVHFLEYLPDCKNYFDFLYIHFLEYIFSLSFLLCHFSYYFHFYYFEYVYFRIIKICGNFEFCNIQRDSREDYKNKINVYKINVIKSYKRYIPAIILLIAIILYENDIKNAAISLPNIIDK